MCIDFLYNFCMKHLSFERDIIKLYIGLNVKYPLFLTHFNETRIFMTDFRKNNHQIS